MLRRRSGAAASAVELYRVIVARAREPGFYREWGVPDTLDGRFDMVAVHAFLVFEALKHKGPAAAELGSKLADAIFTGFDEAFRELGVGDFGMGRRIRNIADAFYGRIEAYGAAFTAEDLAAAVTRNVYRGDAAKTDEARALATYMMESRLRMSSGLEILLAGRPDFAPLPRLPKG